MFSIILKLIAPLAAGITAIISIWSERGHKSLGYLRLMTSLTILIWLVTSAILIFDYNDLKKLNSMESDQTMILKQIRAAQGDDEILNNYVTAQRVVIDKLASHSSSDFINELRNTVDEKSEKRGELNSVGEKLAAEFQVRLIPMQDFILAQLDRRMEALKEDGTILKIEKHDQSKSPVVVVEKRAENIRIRDYEFKAGSHLYVNQKPMFIRSGKASDSLLLSIYFNMPAYYRIGLVRFDFYQDRSIIHNEFKEALGFEDYTSNDNPMSDKKLIDNIVEAINKSILYSIVEDQVKSK
jgi:hypothetical protein